MKTGEKMRGSNSVESTALASCGKETLALAELVVRRRRHSRQLGLDIRKEAVLYVCNLTSLRDDRQRLFGRRKEKAHREGCLRRLSSALIEEEVAQLHASETCRISLPSCLKNQGSNRLIRAGYALRG